ncbi:hypothetical protein WJX73_010504 [Symbiochloris irregularis]|uniref:CTLH domain-containing protein n=1 Tax=Symbiochloris irregularis TaxID=706552 RepID=A0AAW1PVF3_9CHLO
MQEAPEIAEAVLTGRIDDVLRLSAKLGLLQDNRLLFQLRQHEAAEHGRRGNDLALLGCLRQHLAPLALQAYPEAYGEMRASLPKLLQLNPHRVQPQSSKDLPGSDSQRVPLAGLLRRTVRQLKGGCSSCFELMLTHLLLTHRTQQSSAADLKGLAGEREIQHLREAARLTREEAIQSLAHTSGDVYAALNNELSSYHLHLTLLDGMIQEYAAYRRLHQHTGTHHTQKISAKYDVATPLEAGINDGSIRAAKRHCSRDSTPREDSHLSASPSHHSHVTSDEDKESIVKAVKALKMDGLCHSTGISVTPVSSPPRKLARLHEPSLEAKLHGIPEGDGSKVPRQQDFSRLMQLLDKLDAQRFAELEDEIQLLDPSVFDNDPGLLFQLRREQFRSLVNSKQVPEAISFARCKLTPITVQHPQLLPLLKESMAVLLEKEQEPSKRDGPLLMSSLHDNLQAALLKPLGLRLPMLLTLLQDLLACTRQDRGVQTSISAGHALDTVAAPDDLPGLMSASSSEGDVPWTAMGEDDDDENEQVQEEDVLQLMEVTALHRGQAIDLLEEHDGDLMSALESAFS